MSALRIVLSLAIVVVAACGTEKDNNQPLDPNQNNNQQQCTTACECTSALRADALANGNQILGGVTLSESTSIQAILDDMSAYEGQLMQIEGTVIATCTNRGCWASIEDAEGYNMNLKVVDDVIDFRQVTQVGAYVVGEGIFTQYGGHGAQVSIDNHGAMSGTIICP